ncbi:MAG: DUF2460 domain-containing protein [Alphaproteobacteria bacterium]|nr:DUF2460 domain-containing protein [Alphaproteobacteria bacterium]
MSNAVFPTFKGLAYPVSRQPNFTTRIQKATSGLESRAALQAYPLYTITLTFEFLSTADYASIANFFLSRQGAWDNFLFNDPTDNTATTQQFGIGNGTTTAFQLTRSWNGTGFAEPVNNVNGTPTIYINGVSTSAYTINSYGLVTFTTAPANAAILTWSGAYYYRVRFGADMNDFNQFMSNLFELKKLQLIGSVMNRV